MSNTIIFGSNGFIGKEIKQQLSESHVCVWGYNKQEINLLDLDKLKKIFDICNPQVVINAAARSGRRNDKNNLDVLGDNLVMLENILYFRNKLKLMIFFTSGAEYNHEYGISGLLEDGDYERQPPKNYYGLSKKIQTQVLKSFDNTVNILNLRLFNVFGKNGMQDSFIPTAINNYINHQPITIFDNIYFDFFYINDLVSVIDYFISNPSVGYNEYNCVYLYKHSLLDVAQIINRLDNYQVPIIIQNETWKNYYGNGDKLSKLNIIFKGLEAGIKEVYNNLKNGTK